jgi:uncharacterized ferritin-like protein (DUF455 family)
MESFVRQRSMEIAVHTTAHITIRALNLTLTTNILADWRIYNLPNSVIASGYLDWMAFNI